MVICNYQRGFPLPRISDESFERRHSYEAFEEGPDHGRPRIRKRRALTSSDERLSNPFFDPYSPYGLDTGAISERLFLAQADIIKEQADKGSAIFVGRCANDVLRKYDDVVSIFIYAPKNDRIKRIMSIEKIEDPLAADKIVRRTDKARRSYYQFYTDKKWGSTEDMDLMLDSSKLGIEGTTGLIEDYLIRLGYVEN